VRKAYLFYFILFLKKGGKRQKAKGAFDKEEGRFLSISHITDMGTKKSVLSFIKLPVVFMIP
jgi:hypothetical protein